MHKIFTILTLAVFFNGYSQELTPVFEDSLSEGNLLRISSSNYYSSNTFNNDLTDKLFRGGTITTEIKDRATKKLGTINSFGAEAVQTIEHFNNNLHPIRNKNYGLVVSFSDNHLLSTNIASDLYTTAFYGNAGNLNDTMDFAFSHLQYLHFQKMGVGVFERNTLSSIKINYVAGSKGIEGRLSDTWMHSQSDSVTLNLQGAGYKSDRFFPYLGFQGSGLALDANYNFLFETKKNNTQILNLKISNVGFIVWNKRTHNYAVDSTTIYSGFAVNDIINGTITNGDSTSKLIDTLGIQSQQGKYIGALPIEFSLQKLPTRNSNKKMQYLIGFKTILTSDYFPYFYGGLYYAPVANFSASTRLSYGGFGGLQWGLNANLWLKDKIHIAIGTFDMIGFISKNLGYGRSINFSANFKL